jgi:hypothetical protein
MKRAFLLVPLLLAVVVLNANPFIGKWKMDLAGAANSYILEFVDDATYSIVEVNVNTPQYLDYSIDEKGQSLNLGKINNTDIDVRYSFNKSLDTFSLYFKDDYLEKQFGTSFGLPGEEAADTATPQTQFTKDFIAKFKKGLIDMMRSLPVAVGKKIRLPQQ